MSVAVRKDISAEEVYQKARLEKRAKVRSRMLGLAAVIEGRKRCDAAKIAGVTINVFRIWVRRFNKCGFAGLVSKKQTGRKPRWMKEQDDFIAKKISDGARFDRDKRITYRLEDFQKALEQKFGITFGISTIWYKIKKLEFSWITTRQQHPQSDPAAQEEFKKNAL